MIAVANFQLLPFDISCKYSMECFRNWFKKLFYWTKVFHMKEMLMHKLIKSCLIRAQLEMKWNKTHAFMQCFHDIL